MFCLLSQTPLFPRPPTDTGQVCPEMAEVPEEYRTCPTEGAYLGGRGSWGGTEPPDSLQQVLGERPSRALETALLSAHLGRGDWGGRLS